VASKKAVPPNYPPDYIQGTEQKAQAKAMPPDDFGAKAAPPGFPPDYIQGAEQKTAAIPPGPGRYPPPDTAIQGTEQKAQAKKAVPPNYPPDYIQGAEQKTAAVPPGVPDYIQGTEQKVASKAMPPDDFGAKAVPPGFPPDVLQEATQKVASKKSVAAHVQEAELLPQKGHDAQSGLSHLVFFSAAALVAVIVLVGVILILKSKKSSPTPAQIPLSACAQVPLELV
jgi:hypothetical protein